jgi:hypothetical protein
MIELLNELRIALPGVQILFAFLLTVPFSVRFEKLTGFQRDVYYATLIATALSTACLIAPSAAHRLRFHQGERTWIVESANELMIAGLAFLALALGAPDHRRDVRRRPSLDLLGRRLARHRGALVRASAGAPRARKIIRALAPLPHWDAG